MIYMKNNIYILKNTESNMHYHQLLVYFDLKSVSPEVMVYLFYRHTTVYLS